MMHSDSIFCTIFDSNYLDKGLVLYDSMVKSIPEFKLYVFAFDKKCEEILRTENLKNMTVIGLQEFESEEMLRVKAERTKAEYCWTCSSLSIQYVLNNYKEPICTYIDADMMFFSNPQVIFDEMKKRQCSTIIVPHRYEMCIGRFCSCEALSKQGVPNIFQKRNIHVCMQPYVSA